MVNTGRQADFEGDLPGVVHYGIQGPQGPVGPVGPAGPVGPSGKTPVAGVDYFTEEEKAEFLREALTQAKESGEFDGKDGVDGKDGYTPVKGVDYFDGVNGKDGVDGKTPVKGVDYFDGVDGKNGVDGYTPVKGVDYFDGKDGLDGKNGVDGKTPVKGEDYWTATDKQEIVDDVLEQIEIPEGSGGSAEVPVFDLASRGVPAVTLPQGTSQVAGDMSDIVTALSKGSAIFKIPVSLNGMEISISLTMQAFTDGSGGYQCVSMVLQDVMLMAVVSVTSSGVLVMVAPAVTLLGLPFVTGADNGKFMQVVDGSWAAVALQDVSEVGA